ncbi:helix-turn-helix domain-containing protein [Virgibacillus profundi]|nr:helix-turn-helix domain-containing protein [Virgibacillus profundi]
MLVEGIILKCSMNIQGERTDSAIYHILKGKRSIQTVQDIHLYQLENFFGVYKSLKKQLFERKINELNAKGFLQRISTSEPLFKTSKAGVDWLDQSTVEIPYHYFAGLKYNGMANSFFERLTLLIQTLTNSYMKYYKFIPVIDTTSVENWVKALFLKAKSKESYILSTIFQELESLLHYLTDQEAEMFVDRLSGYKNYGMSIHQLAVKYEMTSEDTQLYFTGIIHRMLTMIENANSSFPFMSFILKDISNKHMITNSANSTYTFLKRGYSIDTIAQLRQLKNNTIYDHIVEIALYDANFPIHNYVSKEDQQKIMKASSITRSYKLKMIKQSVDEHISYFQIRLVLAYAKNSLGR